MRKSENLALSVKQTCGMDTSPSLLQAYLERTLPLVEQEVVKCHLDGCPTCHECWNKYRWDRAKGTRGYLEWLTYLQEQGEPLQEYLDSSQALIAQWRELAPQNREEREHFFHSTPFYLSNLVIWHESGHRPPYLTEALPVLRRLHARVVCDFGCGSGSDGLQFLEAGYQVLFCEFDNPASRFLRWRLQQRQYEACWIEPAHLLQADSFDTLWAMDVFDHLPDLKRLSPLLERCRIVCYESDIQQKTHGGESFHIHHPPYVLHALLANAGFYRIEKGACLTVWCKA